MTLNIPLFRKYFLLAVYVAFAAMLAYIFLFNKGFAITEQFNESTGKKDVFIENITGRLIEDITIRYIDNRTSKELATEKIDSLEPQQKYRLNIEKAKSPEIRVLADSNFYSTTEKLVLIGDSKPSIIVKYQKPVLFGQRFPINLEYCNNERTDVSVQIDEVHEELFFIDKPTSQKLDLKTLECKKITYSLLPSHRGQTQIYFNVVTSNSSEQIEEIIQVE